VTKPPRLSALRWCCDAERHHRFLNRSPGSVLHAKSDSTIRCRGAAPVCRRRPQATATTTRRHSPVDCARDVGGGDSGPRLCEFLREVGRLSHAIRSASIVSCRTNSAKTNVILKRKPRRPEAWVHRGRRSARTCWIRPGKFPYLASSGVPASSFGWRFLSLGIVALMATSLLRR